MSASENQPVAEAPCDARAWDLFSFLVVGLAALVQALQWPMTPKFVDIYYHLSVARGFSLAGGYVTTAFWEYAPVGRPHLYPPVLHVIMLGMSKLGLSWITIGRILEAILFPAFLLTLWWIARKTISVRAAFFTVLTAFSVFSLYLSVVVFAPFTLAAMFALGTFLALERNRLAAAAVLLALAMYSHVLMGAMGLLAVLLYGVSTPYARKRAVIVAAGAFVLALPFLAYLYGHRAFCALVSVRENRAIEISPVIYALAAAGLVVALRRRKNLLWPVCLLAAMLPYCGTHTARFLGGHGLLAMTLLAGIAMEELYLLFTGFGKRARRGVPFVEVTLIVFLLLAPVIHVNTKDRVMRLKWFDGTLSHYLSPAESRIVRPKENTIFFQQEYERLARIVRANTTSDDIIWADYSYGGGAIAVMSGRAASSAMMLEVRPYEQQNPMQAARLLIWFKSAREDIRAKMLPVGAQYGLQEVAETDLAFVWLNPAGGLKANVAKPAIPNWLLAVIAAAAVGTVVVDSLRQHVALVSGR